MRIVRVIAWLGLVSYGVFGCGTEEAPSTGGPDAAGVEAESVDAGGRDGGRTEEGRDGGIQADGGVNMNECGADGGEDASAGKVGADAAGESDAGDSGRTPDAGSASFHWIEPIAAHTELAAAATVPVQLRTRLALEVNDAAVFVGDSVIVVMSDDGSGGEWSEAMRWTEEMGSVSLGRLPGADVEQPGALSQARAVNADGSVIVGNARSATGESVAFRWTESGGMESLLLDVSRDSSAHHVSADGAVVAGYIERMSGARAFRWTQEAGAVELGTLPGDVSSMPVWLSADGAVVVGNSTGETGSRLFRWTKASGMVELVGPAGYNRCAAYTGSFSYGPFVGGSCTNTEGKSSAFIYGGGPKLIELGSVENYDELRPLAISVDGEVVIGTAFATSDLGAFRWTEALGVEIIEPLAGYDYTVSGDYRDSMSENGEVFVGGMDRIRELGGFRFTEGAGLQVLAPLEGHNATTVPNITRDGSQAAGSSYLRTEDGSREFTAVTWGAEGVAVSVKSQLLAAGIDLGDDILTWAEFAGSQDILIGRIEFDEGARRLSWRARLP